MRAGEFECVGDPNYELAHRLWRQQPIATLGVAEPGQVDGHQMGVLGEARPGRLEGEQALRPRTEQQGVIVSILALGGADGQPVDGPELRPDAIEPDAQGLTPSCRWACTFGRLLLLSVKRSACARIRLW